MKKNLFLKIICFPLKCIEFIFLCVFVGLIFIIIQPFFWCKTKGKQNLKKEDQARVFVSNHYEIYGPLIVFLRFPYKFRPWVIDKMVYPKTIEEQMKIGLYNNYKIVPKWIKFIIVKIVKHIFLFVLKFIKPIPVSRDNPRANIKAMQQSVDTLEKGKAIFIFPEQHSVKKGVGNFMSGFENLAKCYYQKTGKTISFYPVFISRIKRTFFIEPPVIFNPNNDHNLEKERIVKTLHDSMQNSYENNELNNKK